MGIHFDNQRIDIIGMGREDFNKAMSFFFDDRTIVRFYSADKVHGLVLYWPEDVKGEGIKKLPYQLNYGAACDFAWNWLETAERKPQPDHDGDNQKGWRVYNENWTHVAKRWEAKVGIMPVWAMFGK